MNISTSRDAARVRQEAHATQYDTLIVELKILRVEELCELHGDDGSIIPALPGDMLIEWPTGELLRVPKDEVGRFVSAADDAAIATTMPPEGEQFLTSSTEVTGPADPEEQPTEELSRAELLKKIEERAEAQARIIRDANRQGIIDKAEANAWIHEGVVPDGISVEETEDGVRITRAPGTGAATPA